MATEDTGVLLVNLGTPDAPTTGAVRRYLRQFLSDPRVVRIPRLLWLPILYFVVLPLRSPRSARKYATIWKAEGSPLRIYHLRQAQLLRGYLGQALKRPVGVAAGMRYGNPSIAEALKELESRGCVRILVMPVYPQYAKSTTESQKLVERPKPIIDTPKSATQMSSARPGLRCGGGARPRRTRTPPRRDRWRRCARPSPAAPRSRLGRG